MGSLAGALFGGGKQKTQTVSQSPFQTLPGFAQEGFREAIEAARGFLDDPGIFAAAPALPEQERALEILAQAAEPLTAQRFNEQFDIFFNPFLEQTLDPALADLERVGRGAFGDIGAQASQAGAFGGTRQAVREAELGRGLAQEAGRLSAGIRSQAFESAADRALGQLGRQQGAAALTFDAGEALRQLDQQTQQAPASAAAFLANLAAGIPAGGGTTTQTTQGGGGGIGSTLSGAAALLSVLSDIRLKEDIRLIRTEGDYNIYQFRYKGDDTLYEGVMAHEVYDIVPEAVSEDNGYLKVNYSMIEPEFKEVRHGV